MNRIQILNSERLIDRYQLDLTRLSARSKRDSSYLLTRLVGESRAGRLEEDNDLTPFEARLPDDFSKGDRAREDFDAAPKLTGSADHTREVGPSSAAQKQSKRKP